MYKPHPVIIIGSGLAAYMLAKEFRKLDASMPLVIVTASDGRFYSKPLLSTALVQKKEPEVLAVSSAAAMSQNLKAVIMTHTMVESIDPLQNTIQLSNQEILPYSRLILACGAEVLHAPLAGNAVSDIYSINDLEDYSRFRSALQNKKQIAILGSGLVGCEFANDLISSGFDVSLIAPDSYPLQRLVPEKIGQCLQEAFVQAGVKLKLGCFVEAVNQKDDLYYLSLSDGSEVVAELVLSAVGLQPAIALARKAGLATNRGIIVDQELRTNFANIFALGDCAEVMGQVNLYVAPLLHCARVLAQVLSGQAATVCYPAMPIMVKTSICPIAVQLAPDDLVLDWELDGEGSNYRALAYQQGRLQGFALSGTCTKERVELIKKLGVEK